jgi:hypothetical protein
VEIWPSHNALSWSLMVFNGVKRSGGRGGRTLDVVEVEDGLDKEGGSGGLEGEDSCSLGDKDQGGGESCLIESDPMRLKSSE